MTQLLLFLTLIVLLVFTPVIGVLMVVLKFDFFSAIIATPVLMSLVVADVLQRL